MKGTIVSVVHGNNIYKRAVCSACCNIIPPVSKILSISRAQGSFNSTSNYCENCTESELTKAYDEMLLTLKQIILIQQELDNNKNKTSISV